MARSNFSQILLSVVLLYLHMYQIPCAFGWRAYLSVRQEEGAFLLSTVYQFERCLSSQEHGACCWVVRFCQPSVQRVVKGIFVTRDRPFFFPVKCEMGYFFLVNRDFHTSREAWFCKIIIRETRNKCLIHCEPWFSWWLLFRELWKDCFIFRETWSRPPLNHPQCSLHLGADCQQWKD